MKKHHGLEPPRAYVGRWSKNSLIVKEDDVKIKTDLGGTKFVKLESREDISTIKTPIREYLQRICESDQ